MIALLSSRLRSQIVAIVAVLGLAACSDNVAGTTTAGSTAQTPASLGLILSSAVPSLGATGTFTVTVTAFTSSVAFSSGTEITGLVSPVITLRTNSSNLTLSATTLGTTPGSVTVTYNGSTLPNTAAIVASAGTVTTELLITSGATPYSAGNKI